MGYLTTSRFHTIALDVALAAEGSTSTTRDVMTARLAPYLAEGEVMPDAGLLQELLARFLKDQGEKLLSADSTYVARIRDHRMLKPTLRKAMDQLRTQLRDIRHVFDRVFSPEKVALLLESRNFATRRPAQLIQQGKLVLALLQTPGFAFDNVYFEVTPESLALKLQKDIENLEELHLSQVTTVRRERRVELGHKEEMLAATKALISEASSLLKGLLTFTGRAYQTKGLLPSHRRKGKAEAEPG